MSSRPADGKTQVLLPVGPNPRWETEIEEEEGGVSLKSVAESCVLARSLKQSRDKWLHHTFPKFMSKSTRGKANPDSPQPPPHTIQTKGRCTLQIGPHSFTETIFYEVNYLAQAPPMYSAVLQPPVLHTARETSWATTSPYGASYYSYYPPVTATPSDPLVGTGTPSIPIDTATTLASQATPDATGVAPDLVSKVNATAARNPYFATLLHLVANKVATPGQTAELGLMITSIRENTIQEVQPCPSTPNLQSQADTGASLLGRSSLPSPAKDFDVVIEFREVPNERMLFPRGPVLFHPSALTPEDWELHILLPLDRQQEPDLKPSADTTEARDKDENENPEEAKRKARIVLKRPLPMITDTLRRWIGDEDKAGEYRSIFESMKPVERVYLGYRLVPGPTLSQLQTLALPHPMRLLKHGPMPPPRTRRPPTNPKEKVVAPAKRTASTVQPATASSQPTTSSIQPIPTSIQPQSPATQPYIPRTKSAASVARPETATPTPAKKPKVSPYVVHEIKCLTCFQKDVPLHLGGKYCRVCIDSGRAGGHAAYPFPSSTYAPAPTTSSYYTYAPPSVYYSASSTVLHQPSTFTVTSTSGLVTVNPRSTPVVSSSMPTTTTPAQSPAPAETAKPT